MNIGIFAVDPGGATGVAWGIFDPKHKEGLAGSIKDRMLPGSTTVEGDERTQIKELASLWADFYRSCVRSACLPPDHVFLAVENFVLKPGQTAGGTDSTISLALIWGLEGYRMGRRDEWREHKRGQVVMPGMHLQMAGDAVQTAPNARLKEWGIWVVGREHERSAWRHVALLLKRYMIAHS